uniref:Uncharacterized protein n=1 Tax=Lotus japonicus TaxID=34305 RepID=I3SJP3_LOTJA|nr:unknown [Lotus japonicus]
MSQQVLKHNQGIVRGPPILLFKFKQSFMQNLYNPPIIIKLKSSP